MPEIIVKYRRGSRRISRQSRKLHLKQHLHDATVQTGDMSSGAGNDEIDPTQWTGNQRIVHFGPMAARDPFFYYYPKGWDILYPAHFGFFPYRTKKFRGSSPTVCLSAFGCFFGAAGAVMIYLGFFHLYDLPWEEDNMPTANNSTIRSESQPTKNSNHWFMRLAPLQIIGPIFMLIGVVCFLSGGCIWFWSLNLCNEKLRHSRPHGGPPKRTVHQRPLPELMPRDNFGDKSPYVPPPPPPYAILANNYTEQSMYTPQAEMKLYPPVMPGYSTMSLAHSTTYPGSPYNTLYHGTGSGAYGSLSGYRKSLPAPSEISSDWQEYHASHLRNKFAE